MKRIILLIIAAFCVVSLASCSHTAVIEHPVDDATLRTLTINLDELDLSSQLSKMRNSVSFEDVQKFVSRTSPQTKGEEKDYEIIPQVDEENDTIFYLVQYEKGWKLIASDRRVQPILVESPSGAFEEEMVEKGPAVWIDILAAEMKTVKNASDEELSIPEDEQIAFKKQWALLLGHGVATMAMQSFTKSDNRGLGGHYEYVDTYTEWEDYDMVDHMTIVKMHQYIGLNNYLPLKSYSNIDRAPTGCVALAGTIILCFLHNSIGVPAAIPSSATVSGHVGGSYSMWQGNFSTSIWSSLSYADYYAAAAPLAAFVADTIQTVFGDYDSMAESVELKNKVFPFFGISCNRSNYNATTVANRLISGQPVIVSAKRSVEYNFGIPHYTNGHSFIIDAYKRHRLKYTEVYQWIYDDPGMHPEPEDPFHYVIYYNAPEVSYVKMNWCDNGNGDTWYTLTENWPVVVDNQTYYYAYERKMIYGFEED